MNSASVKTFAIAVGAAALGTLLALKLNEQMNKAKTVAFPATK